ncbi:unnamed protein product [Pedinophyceae sp. YPF-701]|nr:unnamed protein product [Pedinophyceae sp. YPF-701]
MVTRWRAALAALVALVLVGAPAARAARWGSAAGGVIASEQPRGDLEGHHKHKEPYGRPLIGILTQPCHDCPGDSYVAAAFVKWVELSGARAVPIHFRKSDAELKRVFKSINGIVFPGGLTWLWLDAPYVITARKLFKWALEANDKGDVFPIWGTCLGFQLLHILVSDVSRNDLLIETDSVAHPTTLEWAEDVREKSALLEDMPDDLFDGLADPDQNIAMQNHEYGLPPHHYDKWPVLNDWFRILSTSVDRNGTEYVSTMEARKYPFFGSQWHPEKPPFEFAMTEVPHSANAIGVSQYLANKFVSFARQSKHRPESLEMELEMVMNNFQAVFTAREEPDPENYDGPDMTYFFGTPGLPPEPVGPQPDDGPSPDDPDNNKPHFPHHHKHDDDPDDGDDTDDDDDDPPSRGDHHHGHGKYVEAGPRPWMWA